MQLRSREITTSTGGAVGDSGGGETSAPRRTRSYRGTGSGVSNTTSASAGSTATTNTVTSRARAQVAFTNGYNPTEQPNPLLDVNNNAVAQHWRFDRGNPPVGVLAEDWNREYNNTDWRVGKAAVTARAPHLGNRGTCKNTSAERMASRLSGNTRALTILRLKQNSALAADYVDSPDKH